MKIISVLIVEDDPIVSFLHKKILQKNNIVQDPLLFMNGKKAWDFLIKNRSEYYLILLDLNMPVLNGWQFLDKLEEEEDIAKRTKVIIVTSSLNIADIKRAENYSVVEHYLSKPLVEISHIKKLMENLKNKVK